jgi:diguanylate cyclase (GGDEF)-like protein
MDGQTHAVQSRALEVRGSAREQESDAVERAIAELESVLAERTQDPRAREALETLRRAWTTARAGAHTDPLTELPNRAWLRQALEDTIQRCNRNHLAAAVLFLDLDGFKEVNDRHGHHAGDALLQAVAKRVVASIRDGDLVARHGGDEFVVLLERLESPEVAFGIAGRVVDAVSTVYAVESGTFKLSVSVGIALYPQHGKSGGELLRNADLAMYRAKHQGGRRFELFNGAIPHEAPSGIRPSPLAFEGRALDKKRDPQSSGS